MRLFSLIVISLLSLNIHAQNDILGQSNPNDLHTITTAVPFLLITPDTRAGGMGDAGVSTSADANAIHWNISKLAFAEKDAEISLSYSPWLNQIVNDMNLAYMSGYKKLNDRSAVAASLRYFTLGDIEFRDVGARLLANFSPREFAIDAGYAIQLSDKLAGGLAARYAYSNLTNGISANQGTAAKAGTSFAVDVTAFYNNEIQLGDYDATFAAGINISNIGSKMAYTTSGQRDFIPTNLRIGPSLTIDLDEYNKLTFAFDANKLLVPSPPIYSSTAQDSIISGRDNNVGVASGIFGSFTDAPGFVTEYSDGTVEVEQGSKTREELREVNLAFGVEYWYQDQFALRGGYFHEHNTKGGRKYATIGAGIKYNVFSFDFSYLVPTAQNNPLANTLRFTLRLNFDEIKGGKAKPAEEG